MSSMLEQAIIDAAATTGILLSALCIEITSVSLSLVKLLFISLPNRSSLTSAASTYAMFGLSLIMTFSNAFRFSKLS